MFGHVGPRFKWNGIPDPNKMYITILVVTSDCILGPGVGESNTNIHFKVSFTLPKTNIDTKNGHNKTGVHLFQSIFSGIHGIVFGFPNHLQNSETHHISRSCFGGQNGPSHIQQWGPTIWKLQGFFWGGVPSWFENMNCKVSGQFWCDCTTCGDVPSARQLLNLHLWLLLDEG